MSQLVNLNELELVSDTLDQMDLEADAFGFPDPPPDGIHRAALSILGEWTKGQTSQGKTYLMTQLEAAIVAPGQPFDGRTIRDVASTLVLNSGISRIGGILVALKKNEDLRRCRTVGDIGKLFNSVAAGHPVLRVQTEWQVRVQGADEKWKTVLRGMRHFPQRENGSHNPQIENPDTGELITARANIIRYLPLEGS